MATLAAPIIDWAGGVAPQAQGATFANQLNSDDPDLPGQPVMTQTFLAAPSFDVIANAGSAHTI